MVEVQKAARIRLARQDQGAKRRRCGDIVDGKQHRDRARNAVAFLGAAARDAGMQLIFAAEREVHVF